MADSESILQLGIEAARAGDKAEARDLFRLVTREDPNNAQGWLWLAGVAEDREEKRAALERAVQIDPKNDLARKGLAALGGARSATTGATAAPTAGAVAGVAATTAAAAGAAAAATPPPTTPEPVAAIPEPTPVASTPPARSGSQEDLDFADSLDSMDFYEQSAGGAAGGARTYTTDDAAAGGDNWSPPDFGDDSFDLSDYQNRPRVSAADVEAMEREQGGRVVVEGEERRGGGLPSWLVPLVGLLAVLLIGGFLFQQCSNRNAATTSRPTPTRATGSTTTANTSVAGGGTTNTAVAGGGTTTADTAVAVLPGTSATAEGAPTTAFDATLPPDVLTPEPAASAGPPTGQTTIVIEGGNTAQPADQTAVAPGDQTAAPVDTAAAPGDQTAAPVDTAASQPQPTAAAGGGDLSGANPQLIGPEQRITANTWNYVWNYGFGPLKAIGTGTYGGARATRGQWLAVTIAAANTSGQPTTIPDGFFVLKDGQNRVYDFNRAASVDWFNIRGGRGVTADLNAADPFTNESASTVLLFDVPADASNLVLFSRDNTGQGYLIR